ncbi:DUF4157 domain-containing protein [Ornithinimicrobium sp. F0845]|uniref:DUF4157 domain-containing protein n=1 Tax=Ornithinimicrobium sp. F0845 TaxID=2926412 RepID=UPI001FF6C8C1|nr:DUF4157 domain-containing protein [Ornithinimicrobium sp. F0845]MCK0114009.1 DUF4157 domain-containing protein [Ornithinimicrobium sp. F0845]
MSMSGGRGSAALLALLSVLWIGGCSAPGSSGADLVNTDTDPVSTDTDPVSTGAASPGPDTTGDGSTSPAPTSAVTQERVTVQGSSPQERIEAYHVMAEVALSQVEDLWGPDAVRWQVRVSLPATTAEFSELTGGAGLQAPAVTVGSLAGAHIVVHPDSWDRLTPEGRQAVLTHEVTHLAQQGHGPVPAWLGEGMAEFTAHRHSQLHPTEIAGSALDDVRAGAVPRAWPDPAGGDTVWGGYALSWLACLYIAQTWSEDALLKFYEAVADATALSEAFPTVLDVSEAEALERWGAWLSDLAD